MHPLLFVAILQTLGAGAVLCATRGTAHPFAAASGFLWGLALYAFLATGILLGTYVGLPLPRLHPAAALGLTALASVGAWAWILLRVGPSRRMLAGQTLALTIVCLVAALALRVNVSILSVDSFAFIELGLALARITQPEYAHLAFLGARPLLPMLVHGLPGAVGVEYLYFLAPVVAASGIATLAVATFEVARRHGSPPAAAFLAMALGLAVLVSSHFVAFQAVYVHSNALAGWFVLLFFVCTWMALDTRGDRGWWALAAVALWAFSLTRIEAPLFAAAFLCVLALEEEAGLERRPGVALALSLPSLLTCLFGAAAAAGAGRIAGSGRWMAMGAALTLPLVILAAQRRPSIRARSGALRPVAGVGVLVFLVVAVAAGPDPFLARCRILVQNAFVIGNWSGLWALFAALALASPLLGPMRHGRFPLLASAGFLALMFGLAVIAAWRLGWGDSGNRMLTHLVPTLAWIAMVRGATLAPGASARSAG